MRALSNESNQDFLRFLHIKDDIRMSTALINNGVATTRKSSNMIVQEIFNEVDIAMDKMREGNIAFSAPNELNIKDKGNVKLILSSTKTVEQLKNSLNNIGTKYGLTISVAKRMEATLHGTWGVDIQIIGPTRQAISETDTSV